MPSFYPITPARLIRLVASVALLFACASSPNKLPQGPARQHYDRAVAFYAKGSYQRAIESYQLAIQTRPDFTEAHFGLGVSFIQTEFFRGAVLALRRVIELRPIYPEAHFNLGIAYHRLDQHADAIRHYGIARSQQLDLADVDLSLGQAYEMVGRPDSAQTLYLAALEQEPFEANVALARLARGENDTTAYASFLEAASTADSTRFEPWLELGAIYEQRRQLDAAARAYQRAWSLRENHPGLIDKLAGVLAQSGEYARARDLYARVTERDSSDSRAFYNLGVMLDALGDGEQALVAYEKALSIAPHFADGRLNHAINLFEMKRFEEALDSYEALLALEIDADRRQQVTQIVNQLRTALGKD